MIDDPEDTGPKAVQDLIPKRLRPRRTSAVQARLRNVDPMVLDPDAEGPLLFQHSVLCQTCLPYRDPGESIRVWDRTNGVVSIRLRAGDALDPATDKVVEVGLPFGTKPRLVLYHLNAEAVRTQSPVIDVGYSLTEFATRTLRLGTGGGKIRAVKEQLSRLSAANFLIAATKGERSLNFKGAVVDAFELWNTRDGHQRTLWPSRVQLSIRYFESLMRHAVPLNPEAIATLAHTAMGLDMYTWLAQRLHRIPREQTDAVSWVALHDQFGQEYKRIRKFREVFNHTLKQVHHVYPGAKFDVDEGGMKLKHSKPPVAPRLLLGGRS